MKENTKLTIVAVVSLIICWIAMMYDIKMGSPGGMSWTGFTMLVTLITGVSSLLGLIINILGK